MNDSTSRDDYRAPVERHRVAQTLLWVSIGGLILLSSVVILTADAKGNASQLVFGALLPLFGTWVGAVVAFYFSRENFEAASASVREMATSALRQKLAGVPVSKAMISRNQMVVVSLTPEEVENPSKVSLKTRFFDKLRGQVTRLPVLDHEGSVIYMVHESQLYRFIYKQSVKVSEGQAPTIESYSLHDLLNDHDIFELISGSFGFVSSRATLLRAKEAMEQVERAQDVFVTATGRRDGAVVGWIPNVLLEEYAEFS